MGLCRASDGTHGKRPLFYCQSVKKYGSARIHGGFGLFFMFNKGKKPNMTNNYGKFFISGCEKAREEKTMLDVQKKIVGVVVALLLTFMVGACGSDAEIWVKAKGGNVDSVNAVINKNGETITHRAAEEGRVDVLNWLKKRLADVNAKDGDGRTPMYSAAYGGHVEAMKWLKKQGVEANVKDIDGGTPMHLAALRGHVEAMKWLKEQGADVNAKDRYGQTLMHPAAFGGHVEAMKWLREQGVDVDAKDKNGDTATHWAARGGSVEAMKWLKEQGADINAKNNRDQTPLSAARDDEAKEWLRANGAK